MNKGLLGVLFGIGVLAYFATRKSAKVASVAKRTVNGLNTDVNNEFVHKAKQDSVLLSADKAMV